MSLPKAPDDVVTTLLTKAILFLTHATQHAQLNSPLDRMVAIHGLDNSVEYLLRIIVQHLDIEAATGKSLDSVEMMSLAGEVNRYLKDNYKIELPYLTDIKFLRQLRNMVQHGIVDPQTDLPRIRRIVERFFNRIFDVIFGIKAGALKISSLVVDKNIRTFLEEAETLLDAKDYVKSITSCRDAFENAKHEKTKDLPSRIRLLPAILESIYDRKKLGYFLNTVSEELELSQLKIDLVAYRRFDEYVSHLPSDAGYRIMQRPWNEQDARFCYDFVSSTILLWQNSEPEQLYPLNLPDDYEWETEINGIIIPKEFERGMSYFDDNSISGTLDQMEVFFVSRELKDKLLQLKPEHSMDVKNSIFKNEVLEKKINYSIIFNGCHAKLTTNNPERWEVILWWQRTSDISND